MNSKEYLLKLAEQLENKYANELEDYKGELSTLFPEYKEKAIKACNIASAALANLEKFSYDSDNALYTAKLTDIRKNMHRILRSLVDLEFN